MASLCKTSSLGSNWSCFQLQLPIGSALLLFQTCKVDATTSKPNKFARRSFMCPETKPKSHLLHHEVDQHCSGQHEALCIRRSRARTDTTGSCCSTRGLRVVMLLPKPRTTTCHGPFAEHDHGTYGEAGIGLEFPFFHRSLSQGWTDELSETDPPPRQGSRVHLCQSSWRVMVRAKAFTRLYGVLVDLVSSLQAAESF